MVIFLFFKGSNPGTSILRSLRRMGIILSQLHIFKVHCFRQGEIRSHVTRLNDPHIFLIRINPGIKISYLGIQGQAADPPFRGLIQSICRNVLGREGTGVHTQVPRGREGGPPRTNVHVFRVRAHRPIRTDVGCLCQSQRGANRHEVHHSKETCIHGHLTHEIRRCQMKTWLCRC